MIALSEPRVSSLFISTKLLLSIRIFLLAYLVLHSIFDIRRYGITSSIRFLTNFSWVGIIIHEVSSIIMTFNQLKLQKPSKYLWAYDALFSTVATLPWIVSMTFWTFLNDKFLRKVTLEDRFLCANPHISNIIILLFELLVTRIPMSMIGFIWPVIVVYLYAIYSIVLKFDYKFEWPYPFMSFYEGEVWQVSMVFAFMFLVPILVYYFSFALVYLRNRFAPKENSEPQEKLKLDV